MLSQRSPLIAVEPAENLAGHQTREIEGWKIHVSKDLLKQDAGATAKALELLAVQLQEITRVVPAPAVKELRKVPLWFSPEYTKTPPRAEYHPGVDWLRKNRRDPLLVKSVEFTNIRNFERETKRMPNFALHELAHAYHDLVVKDGFGNAEIKAAYDKAKASGLYDKVEQRLGDGRSVNVRAYALSTPQEYFAESSEALFSTNDFYPFQREQLAKHDPEIYALLLKLWGVPAEQPAKMDFLQRKQLGEVLPTIRWLESGDYTTLRPAISHREKFDLVRTTTSGKDEVLVSADQLTPSGASEPLTIEDYELSKDLDWVLIYTNSAKVWRKKSRGDYWVFQRSTGKLQQLGTAAKPSTLMYAKLSPTGTHVGYVLDNNLLVESLAGGSVTPLTTDGSTEIINGTFDWVYEEEFHCRDGWRWSPDGQRIAYWQLNTQDVKKFTMVDNTQGNYPNLKTFAYPKTGETNSVCRIGVVSITGKQPTQWLDIPGNTPQDYYLPRMEWVKHSGELVIQRINRRQNALDVCLADATTGRVRIVLTERDGAWIDLHDDWQEWSKRGDAFPWISERDGWRQLYLVSADGTTTRRVTSGEHDVIKVLHMDEKANRVYYLASPANATQRHLYCDTLTGQSKPKRLTPKELGGWHDYHLSKDGKHAVHVYSAFGVPTKVDLISLPNHKVIRSLVKNEQLAAEVQRLAPAPVEFMQVDIGQGTKLDGWLMKPADFDSSKKYPILFYVYGEPAGQSVMDRWGGKEYLWHLQLTQQGYIVACIDNRGTPCPRGREWRKTAYRKIGTLAAADQAAATRELLKRPYLDRDRVGVWGWSGGGSATMNLLFRYPELYKTGMAIAAVPDMRLYNTIYQERYMGLPQENAADYESGSPITHAAGLQGNLLIVHGTGDDNCHYQGMEKLIDKLVDLNLHFTMLSYPNRSHSIDEGNNTTRHLFDALARYLNQNMPAGAKPGTTITAAERGSAKE